MKILPIPQPIKTDKYTSFTSCRSPLKTLWKEGKLPTVTRDLYGSILTKENCTIDHLIPKSSGGANILDNYALATIENNFIRGDKPLNLYKDKLRLLNYLTQFIHVHVVNFDGDFYINGVLKTFQKIFNKAV